ncbi:hypothetical protein [Streptosporangium canum]|nr:hypothetical protein [Streptosporangium canum]
MRHRRPLKTAEYEIVRDFAARREQVYAAWTRPERFARLAEHLAVQATSSKVSARPWA